MWLAVWHGNLSRAWDGSGHEAIAQIYDHSIFPDTFGWTNAYFGGMPFPNFYPPIFYWSIALLHHSHILSFANAFKLVVIFPMLLIPPALWLLGWSLSNKNPLVATLTSLAGLLLLIDMRFMGALLAGLDYFSTFQIGLYTQPLGFILLIGWFVVYTNAHHKRRKFAAATLLLALTVLANFFNAIAAIVLILATLVSDVIHYHRAADSGMKQEYRGAMLGHILSPFVALCLTLFWVVPVITEYRYFVTRPFVVSAAALFTPALIAWFGIALVGSVLWLRATALTGGNSDKLPAAARSVAWSYLGACSVLAFAVFFGSFGPGWFPLQTARFVATLTFMLAVPVGYALSAGFLKLSSFPGRRKPKNDQISVRRLFYMTGVALTLFLLVVASAPDLSWAYCFYTAEQKKDMDSVLAFSRQHRDGRYLVEVIDPRKGPAWTEASFDARALNSYLGAQGNETIGGVFHEASANVLFTLPTVNAFSNYPDSFGISSMLADDLDFVSRPLEQHIERARFLRVKYLVIRTPAMKERLGKATGIAARHDFGWWSVYELPDQPAPALLTFRPALVVSSFTVKARRRNEMSFIRLAEEQFADGWVEVLLVQSPEEKIDRLKRLNDFGALILDRYEFDNEAVAFELLRKYSQSHPLILLSSEAPLCQRVKAARSQFPGLQVIERSPEDAGPVMEAIAPSYHYGTTSIRQQWFEIRRILENNKVAIQATGSINFGVDRDTITIDYGGNPQGQMVPVLVPTTFHPNWYRDDKEPLYTATPFYILTFVDRSVRLHFARQRLDSGAVWISAGTVVLLGMFAVWPNVWGRLAMRG